MVQCMVVFVACHTHYHSCVVQLRISGLAFVTDDATKMLNNATYFCYIPPRDSVTDINFLESSRRVDVNF